METRQRCPNCGRSLTEDEIYCYFCEFEIQKLKEKHNKNHKASLKIFK